MPVSADFQRFVLEQLGELGAVSARRMFGGVGLYHDGFFFGLLDDDTLYLKVDASNREQYVSRGMKPFCPFPDRPQYEMGGYYEVPADVLEDASLLTAWTRASCQVAMAAQQRKPKAPARKSKPPVRNAQPRPGRGPRRRSNKQKRGPRR